jgi:hypothetical protein
MSTGIARLGSCDVGNNVLADLWDEFSILDGPATCLKQMVIDRSGI